MLLSAADRQVLLALVSNWAAEYYDHEVTITFVQSNDNGDTISRYYSSDCRFHLLESVYWPESSLFTIEQVRTLIASGRNLPPILEEGICAESNIHFMITCEYSPNVRYFNPNIGYNEE